MKKSTTLLLIVIMISSGILFPEIGNVKRKVPLSNIMEVKGKILAVMTMVPPGMMGEDGSPESVSFVQVRLKNTVSGKEHTVRIAPGYYLRMKGFMLHKNDEIRIKAIREPRSHEMKSMEIEVKGKILILRDNYGTGFWKKNEEGQKKSNIFKR